MKKLLLIVAFLLIPALGLASPFLVCDPQAGITTYKLTGSAWVPVSVPAQTDGSIKMDLAASTVGNNALTVAACIVDPVWGEACSVYVPFAYTRPGVPTGPSGIGLRP